MVKLPSNWKTANPKTVARKMLEKALKEEDNLKDAVNVCHQSLTGPQKLMNYRHQGNWTAALRKEFRKLESIRTAVDEVSQEYESESDDEYDNDSDVYSEEDMESEEEIEGKEGIMRAARNLGRNYR